MTKSARKFLLFGVMVLALLLPLVFAAGALAYPGINSSSESQVGPGQTLRQIYGSCQVFMYKLPANVNHTGYLHVEMKYGYPDYDCYIYLIRQNAQDGVWEQAATSDGVSTDPQGWWGDYYGKEIIDFYVEDVLDPSVNTTGDDVVGDAYYVMVQAFDDVSNFELTGYYPRMDFGSTAGDPVNGSDNWYRGKFNYPKEGRVQIYGAPYNSAFNFTPTSEGKAYINTRYPFDAKTKLPKPAYLDGSQLAAFDQYLYPGDWSESGALWDMAGSGPGHWVQNHTQGGTPPFMAPDPLWTRRISAGQTIKEGTNMAPNKGKIYIPLLWMVSTDPTQGRYAPPVSGMSTIGYLGSIQYPQNNWLNKGATKVKSGKVEMKGNLAIKPVWDDPTGAASSTLGWAIDGSVVVLQSKVGDGSWKKAGNGMVVGTQGAWVGKATYRSGAKYRAVWTGLAMKSISVQYRNKVETAPGSGVFNWSAWMTMGFSAVDQPLYPGGEYNVLSASLDPVTGIGFKSTDLVGGVAWPGVVLKNGDATASVTFDGKQPLEIKFSSTNYWTELSLSSASVH